MSSLPAEKTPGRCSLSGVKRLVLKVGTSSLSHPSGRLHLGRMEQLVRAIADQANHGREVVLVTSGAIGAGIGQLKLNSSEFLTVPEKQAAAAVGQGILMHHYERLFGEYGCLVAQVLVTMEDLSHESRRTNSRNTLEQLLSWDVIPIVNENDTVAVEEIRFGDNDTLSARVAVALAADLLVILTDIDGLYRGDPRTVPEAELIDTVTKIDAEIEGMGGPSGNVLARGGMSTKIQAARIANEAGIPLVIANGGHREVIADILGGKPVGTYFAPALAQSTYEEG